jgi:HEPN domain-containing protein
MTPNSRPDEAQALLAAAARDRLALDILARDAQAPAEIALFLAQQALEKAVKAVLALHGVVYRRTHDLLLLEALARDAGVVLPVAHDLLARLGPYAVEFRYQAQAPAAPALSLAEAQDAVRGVLDWARAAAWPGS